MKGRLDGGGGDPAEVIDPSAGHRAAGLGSDLDQRRPSRGVLNMALAEVLVAKGKVLIVFMGSFCAPVIANSLQTECVHG